MKPRTAIVLAVMVAFALAAVAQIGSGPAPGTAVPALRILAPRTGDKINTSFVQVQFEAASGNAAGTPEYDVQLDGRDPVRTTSTTHTFTGIRPGNHTVRVQPIDANGTPQGPGAAVDFTVVPGPASPGASVIPADLQTSNGPPTLPASGSELPLLSIIGFGVLVGGILSAMRGR